MKPFRVCVSILRGPHVRHLGKFFWCAGRRFVSKWKVENTGTGDECMHRNKCIHGSHKCDVETIQKIFGASKIPAESLSHTVSLKCAAPHLQDSAADGRGLFWGTWGIGMDLRRGDAPDDPAPKYCTIKRLLLLFPVIYGKNFLSLAFSPAPFLPSKMGLHGASGAGCFQANLCISFQANLCIPKHPWKSDLCPFCWNSTQLYCSPGSITSDG